MTRYISPAPLNFSEAVEQVNFVIDCDRVPFLRGSPGVGKSAVAQEVARRNNLFLIDIRLAQHEPVDLNGYGFLVNDKLTFAPMDMFPLEGDELPCEVNEKGEVTHQYDGWLILFDELNSSDRSVQAAAYKPILDHMLGQHKIHPAVKKMAAGNYMSDNAVTNVITSALVSRMVFLDQVVSLDELLRYAYKNNWSSSIEAFLSYRKEMVHTFDPNQEETPYACSRTWETASKFHNALGGGAIPNKYRPAFIGAIGLEAATAFVNFTNLDLPTLAEMLADPDNFPIPEAADLQYGICNLLVHESTEDNVGDILRIVSRMMPELIILYLRTAYRLNPYLGQVPDYRVWLNKFREAMKTYA